MASDNSAKFAQSNNGASSQVGTPGCNASHASRATERGRHVIAPSCRKSPSQSRYARRTTNNSDEPTLDLSNSLASAQGVAADFEANKQFRKEAFGKLLEYLEADAHLDISLVEAYVYFAEEISADADVFSDIVGRLALQVALSIDEASPEA
ncbi:hypothetical protein KZC52_03520 [Microbacterium sp. kSW2-24]|uniref:hypothetical protein n=1 Tax=Microbacterium galbinum TaxID=2851646 RepID=UPI001FFD1E40|nr:hypothetical protein [Microbacterium galbinum]MCK2021978.1 hypothetical protein [Microbacterium galbinum]